MSIVLEGQIKSIEKLRKQIFQCKLTGDPIVVSDCDTTGRERDARRILFWQTGILKLKNELFFDLESYNKSLQAKAKYTHPIRIFSYDHPGPAGKLYPAGFGISMSYNVYNWLISHEDTQVVDFLRGKK